MPVSQDAFLLAVKRQLGLDTPTELGEAAGAANAYSQAHKWLKGERRLSFQTTMRLLELAGWLTEDARRALEAAEVAAAAERAARAEAAATGARRRRADARAASGNG